LRLAYVLRSFCEVISDHVLQAVLALRLEVLDSARIRLIDLAFAETLQSTDVDGPHIRSQVRVEFTQLLTRIELVGLMELGQIPSVLVRRDDVGLQKPFTQLALLEVEVLG